MGGDGEAHAVAWKEAEHMIPVVSYSEYVGEGNSYGESIPLAPPLLGNGSPAAAGKRCNGESAGGASLFWPAPRRGGWPRIPSCERGVGRWSDR